MAGFRQLYYARRTDAGGKPYYAWLFSRLSNGTRVVGVEYLLDGGTAYLVQVPLSQVRALAPTVKRLISSVCSHTSSGSGSTPPLTTPSYSIPPSGYPVTCTDGTISNAGGKPGACSHHGGELYGGTNSTPAAPTYTTPTYTPPGNYIPYPGNGGGPTACSDGTYSNSSGSGTCSDHGGEAG